MITYSQKWYKAALSPSVMGIPCLAFLPIFIWMLHMRMWTFYLSVGVILFSGILTKRGYSMSVLFRKISSSIRGSKNIPGNPWWYTKNLKNDN